MDLSTKVNIVLSVLSFILAAISIVTVVITLRQNNKMIEESSRPVISIYSQSINAGTPMLFIVVKNFGSSSAVINKFDYDYDLTDCYSFRSERDYLKDLVGSTLAPKQSRICSLDYSKLTRPITFTLEYTSGRKKYKDSLSVDLKAGVNMPAPKTATEQKEPRTISYILQEMLQKNL